MTEKAYSISLNNSVSFNNNAAFCIGTGRMNLALRREYHAQLTKVQEDIGFSYIRGHGLFCDDMAVYHTYTEDGVLKEEYNFTYVDMVFDGYLELGIKPFVEFGFMPGALASGGQTVFWWKGNVTPPNDYDRWARLVRAIIRHWLKRYGADEVRSWFFEVWNEPNLSVFWENADMNEYFKLYEVTAKAVRDCDERLRVGGPAICGVDDERWMRGFLEFCSVNSVPLDFITRHAYGTESPVREGHYVYQKLRTPEDFIENEIMQSRALIDSFPQYRGMEMHITEFNTSYNPRNPVHDTNLNAAYIARLLSELGDACASYSYWTFGDVFEESGVAFTPFSGCFGLLANGMIPKPAYYAFMFFKELFPTAIARSEHFVITKSADSDLRGVAWNLCLDEKSDVVLNISADVEGGTYFLLTKTVDEEACNPLGTWLDMGSPAYPSKRQLKILQDSAQPQIRTKRIDADGEAVCLSLTLSPNALCFFELQRIEPETDRGFDITRI